MSDPLMDGEIEITPQMIEAGMCEAMTHPGEPLAGTISAIYAAMEVERLAGRCPDSPAAARWRDYSLAAVRYM